MEDRWVARPGRRALRREHLTHRGLPPRGFSARRVQGRSELSEPCPLMPGHRGPALSSVFFALLIGATLALFTILRDRQRLSSSERTDTVGKARDHLA